MFQMYRWGNTPLDEAILSGNSTLIELLEEAKSSQLSSQITSSSKEPFGIQNYLFAYLLSWNTLLQFLKFQNAKIIILA